jgi:hypothetical protein
MPRYANFSSSVPSPSPVLGWYDTDALDYPTLPAPADMLEMSDAQWDARLGGVWAVDGGELVAYTPPPRPPNADQVYDTKIAAGIAITSTSTPDLTCTMALDSTTMDQIGAVARDASSGLGLPGGLDTFTYPDIDSTPRAFSQAQIIALYRAQRDLIYQLSTQAAIMRQGLVPSWPAQTATIP